MCVLRYFPGSGGKEESLLNECTAAVLQHTADNVDVHYQESSHDKLDITSLSVFTNANSSVDRRLSRPCSYIGVTADSSMQMIP